MYNYILKEKTQKKNLWGGLVEDSILSELKALIEEENDNDIEITIDLEGIETIDISFIHQIFIDLFKDISGKNISIVFKNIENKSIQYYLTKSFTENNIEAKIEQDDGYVFI